MTEMNRPRGTRDFGPDEMALRRYVESEMRTALSGFGYREVQTPTFEHLDLFVAKSGQQVVDQIYGFKDKGGRDLALRPELTAPVMRFFQSELRNEPKPLRIFYFGNCFRYERPQKGRYREFWQMGLEHLGKRTPLAYAEVISAAISALKGVGSEDFVVRVGDVSLLGKVLGRWDINLTINRELAVAIDKKDKGRVEQLLSGREGASEIAGLLSCTYPISEAPEMIDLLLEGGPEDLAGGGDLLKGSLSIMEDLMGDKIVFDPSITRGLDYYDSVVFEIDAPALGAEKQICGGGGYSMSSIFNKEVEGIGFGLGFDRVVMMLGTGWTPETSVRNTCYLIPIGERAEKECLNVARMVRACGNKCLIETQKRPIKKAISYGLGCGARQVIIMGDAELDEGKVSVKDLSTRKQVSVPLEGLVDHLNGK